MKAIAFVVSIVSASALSVWASENLNGTKVGEMLLSGFMSMTLTLGILKIVKLSRHI